MISSQETSPEGDSCRNGSGPSTSVSTSSQNNNLQTQTSFGENFTDKQRKLSISEDNKLVNDLNDSPLQESVSNEEQLEEINAKLVAAMKLNNDDTANKCDSTNRLDSQPTPKGKNSRKKRRKQSNKPSVDVSIDSNQVQFPPMASMAMNGASAHDYFLNYVSPLYANTNSRYLENLTHHPQFQYMPQVQNHLNAQQTMNAVSIQYASQSGSMTYTMQTTATQQSLGMQQQQASQPANVQTRPPLGRQYSMQTPIHHTLQHSPHPASAPTTPLGIHQRPSTGSIPNSPNTGFFQNMMQHPLLNHTYGQSNFKFNFNVENMQQNHVNANMQQHHVNANMHQNHANAMQQNHVKATMHQSIVNPAVRKENDLNSSPKRQNKKNNKKADTPPEVKRFEPYMSAVEVEIGLNNNTLFEGVLRINPKQFQHAYISTLDREEQDIFIDGLRNRNRALEGDVVVVQLIVESEENQTKNDRTGKEEKNNAIDENEVKNGQNDDEKKETKEKRDQKRGKVVCIKEKVHTRTCIGNLKLMPDKNRQKALFIPRDHRVPRLNIPFTCWPDNFFQDAKRYENTLFLAKIQSWTDTRFAIGKILTNIGQSGNMKTETMAILAENDLDITPYGPEVRDLFPRLDYTIPEEEISKREDCRDLCIFSIDPSNCRDIDDAVSCRELSNGNFEVGVHISDVAHYLTEDTILDEKVAKKATTIYLVERAYHMLPDELCMLCSLFPGVDKLAFSVFWEITKDGQVLSHRFAKTVINSCCQLAYEHAQAILERKEDAESSFPETYNKFEYDNIRKSIEIIGSMAAIFRKNRFENGALRIDQPKVAFRLSPVNGLPDSYSFYEIKESHQMIEEFMLLANQTVAQRIYDDHPQIAFLRCHPPPSGFMLKQLAKALDPMGIVLDISSAGALHRSLLPYTTPSPTTDRGRAMVLNMLCAKPMTRAKYFCAATCEDDDFLHYALNIPIYTHFTSPIRRYADIMVHRLLAASLNFRETPKWEVDKVRMIAAQCNKQKYNAKKAGEMSSDLYMLKYIESNSPILTEAVVVEVREKYIDVIVVAMALNRRIFFNLDFPGEFNCIKHECGSIKMSKMEITWRTEDNLPETKQVIEVFSILQVHLHKSDEMTRVETKLVRPQ